ncbi:MAG: hypothetical protein ACAH80_09560 [Alphaproteobacteria bacterium]
MPMGPEEFVKANDYTLVVSQVYATEKLSKPTLTKIFNFAAQEVSTIYERGYAREGMGVGFAITRESKNFSELDSLDEVALMRAKLVDLGGHPPELPTLSKPRKLGN